MNKIFNVQYSILKFQRIIMIDETINLRYQFNLCHSERSEESDFKKFFFSRLRRDRLNDKAKVQRKLIRKNYDR